MAGVEMVEVAEMTDLQPATSAPHIPVMLEQMLDSLSPLSGELYVDATFGAGGYSRAILERADCNVIGIDRDETVQPYARVLEDLFPNRFTLLIGTFGDMQSLLTEHNINQVNGVVMDIGVSSMQLDNAERGFSFMKDAPLDMRMGNDGETAADFINSASEQHIADVLYQYGEERKSYRVAKYIINERRTTPIRTTSELARLVEKALGNSSRKYGIHPATRTFQALRIYINDELGQLESGLSAALKVLSVNGRLVVVSFHSLEDRMVKQFMRDAAANNELEIITKKPLIAPDSETRINPRSRSAKMRVARKKESSQAIIPTSGYKMDRGEA
jgi:16S rRNA (cytosine1402-N4)-methyltransferase